MSALDAGGPRLAGERHERVGCGPVPARLGEGMRALEVTRPPLNLEEA